MLLQNTSIYNQYPLKVSGGPVGNEVTQTGFRQDNPYSMLLGFAGISKTASIPNGYRPPYSWILPKTVGGMAVSYSLNGTGTISFGNLAGGKNGTATITATGTINAAVLNALGLMVDSIAASGTLAASIYATTYTPLTITGSGNITNCTLTAVANIVGAILDSTTTLSANITGAFQAVAALAGAGDLTGTIAALAYTDALLSGIGDVTNAKLSGRLLADALITATGSIDFANLIGGIYASAALAGVGDITTAKLLGALEAAATLAGSGDVTGAIHAVVQIKSDLAGSGNIDLANLIGHWLCVAVINGAGSIDAASITALGDVVSSLIGTGTLTASERADGYISADIGQTTDPLVTQILNASIDGTYTLANVLKIIAAVSAGKVTGGPDSPVFRSLSDDGDVVSGTVDNSGNRTAVTLNP